MSNEIIQRFGNVHTRHISDSSGTVRPKQLKEIIKTASAATEAQV